MPTNFNVDRIDEVSVPGMVSPTEAVGVVNAPEAPAKTPDRSPGNGGRPGRLDGVLSVGHRHRHRSVGRRGRAGQSRRLRRPHAATRAPIEQLGGSPISEACVAKGLSWLARHQASDGRWSLNEFNRHAREAPFPHGKTIVCNCTGQASRHDDLSATAFALLPFLAAGITHRPSKTPQKVEYHRTVDAGIKYIISKQAKDGYYGGGMYSHGLTSIAMCEAFGLTSDPTFKVSAQKAINYIIQAQDAAGGGWRYSPRRPATPP